MNGFPVEQSLQFLPSVSRIVLNGFSRTLKFRLSGRVFTSPGYALKCPNESVDTETRAIPFPEYYHNLKEILVSDVALDNIPDELKSLPQWVCWRKAERDGKTTKLPVNPHTGALASTTDSSTWGTLTDAYNAIQRHSCDGIGFVFTHDDPYAGVDLDKCRNPETGVLEPWAQAIVDAIQTDRIFSATRQGWSKGRGGCDASMKLCLSSSRCESCLAKGEPTRASSKPCADPRDGVGDA